MPKLPASAYLMWGFFPAFFPLLLPAGPFEILAHRIVWTAVLVTGYADDARQPIVRHGGSDSTDNDDERSNDLPRVFRHDHAGRWP